MKPDSGAGRARVSAGERGRFPGLPAAPPGGRAAPAPLRPRLGLGSPRPAAGARAGGGDLPAPAPRLPPGRDGKRGESAGRRGRKGAGREGGKAAGGGGPKAFLKQGRDCAAAAPLRGTHQRARGEGGESDRKMQPRADQSAKKPGAAPGGGTKAAPHPSVPPPGRRARPEVPPPAPGAARAGVSPFPRAGGGRLSPEGPAALPGLASPPSALPNGRGRSHTCGHPGPAEGGPGSPFGRRGGGIYLQLHNAVCKVSPLACVWFDVFYSKKPPPLA